MDETSDLMKQMLGIGTDGKIKSLPKPEAAKPTNGLDVPAILDDELSRLGWTPNARMAMISNVGRENNWNPDTIFNEHIDPASNTNGRGTIRNRGIISWNNERRTAMEDFMRRNGGDFTPSERNLRLQAQFLDQEIRTGRWGNIAPKVADQNLNVDDYYPVFQKYILYQPRYESVNKKYEKMLRDRGFTTAQIQQMSNDDAMRAMLGINQTKISKDEATRQMLGLGNLTLTQQTQPVSELSALEAKRAELYGQRDALTKQTGAKAKQSIIDLRPQIDQLEQQIQTIKANNPNYQSQQGDISTPKPTPTNPFQAVVPNDILDQKRQQLLEAKTPQKREKLANEIISLQTSGVTSGVTSGQNNGQIQTLGGQTEQVPQNQQPQNQYTRSQTPKYQFEIDGKTPDGLNYLGQLNGKYRFNNADGDEFELDETSGNVKSVGFPKTLPLANGLTLTKADENGNYVSADGKKYRVTRSETGQFSATTDEQPAWVTGKTKPTSEITDAQLAEAYKVYTDKNGDYKLEDTEELRQHFLNRFNEIQKKRADGTYNAETDRIFNENEQKYFEAKSANLFNQQNQARQTQKVQNLGTGNVQNISRQNTSNEVQNQATQNNSDFALTTVGYNVAGLTGDARERGVFEQAVRNAGNRILGRPLDALEVSLLAGEQQKEKGGFVYSREKNADGTYRKIPLDEIGNEGVYYFEGADLERMKDLLEKNKANLDAERDRILAKAIAYSVTGDLSEEEIADLEKYGISREKILAAQMGVKANLSEEEIAQFSAASGLTREQILAASAESGKFDEARAQRDKNREFYNERAKYYSSDEYQTQSGNNYSPVQAQARAMLDAGAITQSRFDEISAKEDEARKRIEENFKNPNYRTWLWEQVKQGMLSLPDYFRDVFSGEYDKNQKEGLRQRLAQNAPAVLARQIGKEYGGYQEYEKFMRENAGGEYNPLRVAKYFGGEIVKGASNVFQSLAALDSYQEQTSFWRFIVPDEYIPSIRTAQNALEYIYSTVTGSKANYQPFGLSVNERGTAQITRIIKETIGEDRYLAQTATGQVTSAFASGVTFLLGGFALKGMKYSAAVLGAFTQIGSTYDELRAAGVDDEKARNWAIGLGGLLGASEQIGIGGTANRLLAKLGSELSEESTKTLLRAAWQFSKEIGKTARREAKEEFWQEFGQSTVGQAAIKAIAAKNKSDGEKLLQFFTDLPTQAVESLPQAALGAVTGAVLGGGTETALRGGQAIANKLNPPAIDFDLSEITLGGQKYYFPTSKAETVKRWQNALKGLAQIESEINNLRASATNKSFEEKRKIVTEIQKLQKEANILGERERNLRAEFADDLTLLDAKKEVHAPADVNKPETTETAQTPVNQEVTQNQQNFENEQADVQDEQGETFFSADYGFVEKSGNQENLLPGEVRIQATEGENAGREFVVKESDLATGSRQRATAQGISFDRATSEVKNAPVPGAKVIIEGRGIGEIVKREGKMYLVDFNPRQKSGKTHYQSRMSFYPKDLKFADGTPLPTGKKAQKPNVKQVVKIKPIENVSDEDALAAREALRQIRARKAESGKGAKIEKFPENFGEKLQTVYTPDNRELRVAPLVVDDSDILTSFDADYPEILQPRNRSSAASDAQITEIAKNLIPAKLGDNFNSNDGRPIAVPVTVNGKTKYALVTGNGRVSAVRLARERYGKSAEKYAEFVKNLGESKAENPVYIAVLDNTKIDDADLRDIAVSSNKSNQSAMSPVEQAKVDAESLDNSIMKRFAMTDSGDIGTEQNRGFIREFFTRNVSENERGGLIDKDGVLTSDGVNRIKRAVIARAFGETRVGLNVLSNIIESTDDTIKNVTTALVRVAPRFADLKAAVEAGEAFPEIEITEQIAAAFNQLSDIRAKNGSVETFVGQQDLPGSAGLSPLEKNLLELFDHYSRAPRQLTSVLNNYLDGALSTGNPNQGNMFGERVIPDPRDLVAAANEIFEEETGVADEKRLEFTEFGQEEQKARPRGRVEENDQETPQTQSGSDRRLSEGRGDQLVPIKKTVTAIKFQGGEILDEQEIPEDIMKEYLAQEYEKESGKNRLTGSVEKNVTEKGREISDSNQLTVNEKAHEAATSPQNDLREPTQAQREAGNYQLGHIKINGLDISIEIPVGGMRKGVNKQGVEWSREMKSHYGYIKRSIGADEENLDVFIEKNTPTDFSGDVFIVDQIYPDSGDFDEHKIMLGFRSEAEAKAGYLANYAKDWQGLGAISAMPFGEFKTWVRSEQNKPVAENTVSTNTISTDTVKSDYGAKNKLVSQEKADRAREILRKKLAGNQMNIGVDPEIAQAGLELAVFHIEAGARKFADFAKAMIEDMGEGIRPYLQSFYMSAKYYPGLDNSGMNSESEIENFLKKEATKGDKTETAKETDFAADEIGDFDTIQKNYLAAMREEGYTEEAEDWAVRDKMRPTEEDLKAYAKYENRDGIPLDEPDNEKPFGDALAPKDLFGNPLSPETAQADLFNVASIQSDAATAENEKNTNIFGQDLGSVLNDFKNKREAPTAQKAAQTIIKMRSQIENKIEILDDFLSDVQAALEAVHDAEITNVPFEQFINQGSFFDSVELSEAQRKIYDIIAKSDFPHFLGSIIAIANKNTEYIGNDSNRSSNLEQDSAGVSDENAVRETDISARQPLNGGDALTTDEGFDGKESQTGNGESFFGNRALSDRTRSDSGLFDEESATDTANARNLGYTRSDDVSDERVSADDARRDEASEKDFQQSQINFERKKELQTQAEKVDVKLSDKNNIAETLPLLFDEQKDDVLFAENAFYGEKNHLGVLFTNSTGTGKTFTGLGIIKRFAKRGKDNILVVAPSQEILNAWQSASAHFLLSPKQLVDTTDNGKSGIVLTTYANLQQNPALIKRKWDLIVTDEAHKVSSNQAGELTGAAQAIRAITLHKRAAYDYARQAAIKEIYKLDEIEREIDGLKAQIDRNQFSAQSENVMRDLARLREQAAALKEEIGSIKESALEEFSERVKTEEKTPVLFLSATPFAYQKSIEYAEGYLFDFDEGNPPDGFRGYNQPSNREKFFITHFGYRMRYNKLTQPDADVDTGIMERAFNSWLKKRGVLSGRMLSVEADYSRNFVLTEDAVGTKIDEGLNYLRKAHDGLYAPLADIIDKQFKYHARMYLLEAMKAKAGIPIIKKHLALGRKVVVFHNFNKGGGFHPFRHNFAGITVNIYRDGKTVEVNLRELYEQFAAERQDLINLDLSGLSSPIKTFRREFENALFVNGTVSKRENAENIRLFNTDNSGADLIVVQSDKGQAGISLHDTSGKHQRVLINLGLPVKPVAAIQTEGRIYRLGSATNAIQLYLNTGTGWERTAFARTIAERASTAENLALGEEARMLKASIIESFENSLENYEPGETEGVGGKERDAANRQLLSDWDKAKSYYFGQQKKTSKNKAAEGIDYFPTPEPVGLKMVEFANLRQNESALEPSAGHGAIARWFPANTRNTFIEPETDLISRVMMVADGTGNRFETLKFEDLHVSNKYDAIVMNPPYGTGGKTAVEHLEKAISHLRTGGRIVALLPEGASADKRLEKLLYESDAAKHIYKIADISLPPATFERAGTRVKTHIVVLEKQINPDDVKKLPSEIKQDFSSAENIKELFDRIKDFSLPERIKPERMMTGYTLSDSGEIVPIAEKTEDAPPLLERAEFTHTRDGYTVYVAKLNEQVDDDIYRDLLSKAKQFGGWYNRYGAKYKAVKGFAFKSAEAREEFLTAAAEGESSGADLLSAVENWKFNENELNLFNDKGDINYGELENIVNGIERGNIKVARLNAEEERGRIAGGRRNVEASVILGTKDKTSRRDGTRSRSWEVHKENVKPQENILEKYAVDKGIWFDYNTFDKEYRFFRDGTESDVYFDKTDENYLIKLIGYDFAERQSPLEFIDNRIALHNTLFPDTKYTLVGFTRDKKGFFRFVLRQLFIQKDGKYDIFKIEKHLKDNYNLTPTTLDSNIFKNERYIVRDLHDLNVITSKGGMLHFVDPIVSINKDLVEVSPFSLKAVSEPENPVLYSAVEPQNEPFYSAVEKAVEKFAQEKFSTDQLRGILNKPENKIKDLEASAIFGTFLDENKGKILTKAEVLDFIGANGFVVETVIKGEVSKARKQQFIEQLKNKGYEVEFDDNGQPMGVADKEGYFYDQNERDELPEEIGQLFSDLINQYFDKGDARFAREPYIQPGGTNHIEVFLTDTHFARKGEKWNDGHAQYADIRNPIVRIRGGVYTTAAGKKIFVIQELQLPNPKNIENVPKIYRKYGELLGFKWALRYAAEQGFDEIAFTSGATQAERYNLERVISRLEYRKAGLYYDKYAVKIYDKGVRHTVRNELFTEQQLERTFGKEITRKIVETAVFQPKVIDKLGLKVGGENLKRRYDETYPKILNKYLGIFNAKVENVQIEVPRRTLAEDFVPDDIATFEVRRIDDSDWGWAILKPDGKIYREGFPSRENAQYWLDDAQSKAASQTFAHSVRITPELAESVWAGQPLFSAREEAEKLRAFELVKTVSLVDLAPTAIVERNGDRVRGNIQTQEILRRALEQRDIDRGNLNVGEDRTRTAFEGLFIEPPILRDVIKILRSSAAQAKEFGYPEKIHGVFSRLAAELEEAYKQGGKTAVFYTADEKLPQELYHQASYLGAIEKALTKRYANPPVMDDHTAVKSADKNFFSRFSYLRVENLMRQNNLTRAGAENLRRAIIREETAAWIAEGAWEKLGIDFETAMDYLNLAIESYAEKNGNEGLEKFKEINDYVRQAAERALETPRDRSEREAGRTAPRPKSAQNEQRGTPRSSQENVSSESGRLEAEPRKINRPVQMSGQEKLASLPKTSRSAGIAASDVAYEVFGDAAAQAAAQKLIEDNGIEGTIKLLEQINEPDVHHAIASFSIQKMLLDEAERVRAGNPKEARRLTQIALRMASNHALQAVKAGRFIRAASIIQQSVASVLGAAQAVYESKHGRGTLLPPKVEERVRTAAESGESALAETDALGKEIEKLKREIEVLKKALAGDSSFRRASKNTLAKRRKIVGQIKAAHQTEFERAMERLRRRAGMPAVNKSEVDTAGVLYSAVETTAEMSPEELNDYATVGAMKLSEGLATPDSMFPSDFDAEMVAEFGETIKPVIKEIHRAAYLKRDQWLKEIAKKKKVAEIKAEFGENLTDEEIEQILGERAEEFARRGAIEKLHKIRAKDGNLRSFTRLEEIIAEIAPSEEVAAAAGILAVSTPTASRFYETLEFLGYKGAKARDILREARDILNAARERLQKEHDDLQSLIGEKESEVEEYENLRDAARRRLKESQQLIGKELRRISTGEYKYLWNEYGLGFFNSFRAVMTSGEIGFVLRQGNWFTIINAFKGNAQKQEWANLVAALRTKSFERVMSDLEKHPAYPLAVKSGVEFAGLGRFDEKSLSKGEEDFRHNLFEKIPGLKQSVGKFIEKSESTMIAFLDTQRMNVFAANAAAFERTGLTFETHPKEFKALAGYINNATGRTTLGSEKATSFLMNLPLFAPRYLLSRVKHLAMIAPVGGWIFLPKHTRKVVLKDMAIQYAAIGGILTLAHILGLTTLDWDDADFLKIKLGNQRYDITGGLQNPLRFFLQMMSAAARETTGFPRSNVYGESGKVNELRHDFLDADGFFLRFWRSKLNPLVSLGLDYATGEDMVGNEFSWGKALLSRSTPIFFQDVISTIKNDGAIGGIESVPGFFGIGAQNYADRPEQAQTPAERLAVKINGMRMLDKVEAEAEKELNNRIAEIKARARKGENMTAAVSDLYNSGQITLRRAQNLLRGFDDTYFESKINRMPTKYLRQLRRIANDSEKTAIDEVLKIRLARDAKNKNLKPEERQKAAKEFEELNKR